MSDRSRPHPHASASGRQREDHTGQSPYASIDPFSRQYAGQQTTPSGNDPRPRIANTQILPASSHTGALLQQTFPPPGVLLPQPVAGIHGLQPSFYPAGPSQGVSYFQEVARFPAFVSPLPLSVVSNSSPLANFQGVHGLPLDIPPGFHQPTYHHPGFPHPSHLQPSYPHPGYPHPNYSQPVYHFPSHVPTQYLSSSLPPTHLGPENLQLQPHRANSPFLGLPQAPYQNPAYEFGKHWAALSTSSSTQANRSVSPSFSPNPRLDQSPQEVKKKKSFWDVNKQRSAKKKAAQSSETREASGSTSHSPPLQNPGSSPRLNDQSLDSSDKRSYKTLPKKSSRAGIPRSRSPSEPWSLSRGLESVKKKFGKSHQISVPYPHFASRQHDRVLQQDNPEVSGPVRQQQLERGFPHPVGLQQHDREYSPLEAGRQQDHASSSPLVHSADRYFTVGFPPSLVPSGQFSGGRGSRRCSGGRRSRQFSGGRGSSLGSLRHDIFRFPEYEEETTEDRLSALDLAKGSTRPLLGKEKEPAALKVEGTDDTSEITASNVEVKRAGERGEAALVIRPRSRLNQGKPKVDDKVEVDWSDPRLLADGQEELSTPKRRVRQDTYQKLSGERPESSIFASDTEETAATGVETQETSQDQDRATGQEVYRESEREHSPPMPLRVRRAIQQTRQYLSPTPFPAPLVQREASKAKRRPSPLIGVERGRSLFRKDTPEGSSKTTCSSLEQDDSPYSAATTGLGLDFRGESERDNLLYQTDAPTKYFSSGSKKLDSELSTLCGLKRVESLTSGVKISERLSTRGVETLGSPPPVPGPPCSQTRKVSDLRAKFEQKSVLNSAGSPTVASVSTRSGGQSSKTKRQFVEIPLKSLVQTSPIDSPGYNPLESFLFKNKSQREAVLESPESILDRSDLPPPIPRKSSKRNLNLKTLGKEAEEFSQLEHITASHFAEPEPELPQVTVGAAASEEKENPITPENQKQRQFQDSDPNPDYSPSVYSEAEFITPPEFASLVPRPLTLNKDREKLQKKDALRTLPKLNFIPETPTPDPSRSGQSFLDTRLQASFHPAQMETLQVPSAIRSSTRAKAMEDARAMQASVIETCRKAGKEPPKYVLLELIGKGSFGRVYKGKDVQSAAIVAVKIIDIDEGDTLNPRLADTYSDFLKEVNALKILSESKARNINHIIEALPVGKAMWMVTEYCGGGSIATLMKPTPSGLKERFIIPILREVAEAVKWVHQAGIIHRDLKCANILITEEGGVQLCDFGVAGITETSLDKRSTFSGTFNWMAPELFQGSSYGKEVDIWAFGSMAYEMATGLPPNAMSGVTGMDLGPYLKTHIPRLEGGNYSDGLRSIVAFCLEENPSDRPTIEAVQKHGYICNTSAKYPASSLSELVKAFKMWESDGGIRRSLFLAGAQAQSEISPTALSDDNWNFSTTAAFDQAVAEGMNEQDVINVYGSSVALGSDFQDETSHLDRQQQSRQTGRRPPKKALAPLKAPLEKLFDPNTMSNYEENSRAHYNLHLAPASDLPLRDDSAQISIRDTLIDLDDPNTGMSSFSDMDTIKASRRLRDESSEDEYDSGPLHDFSRPALSDPADNPNRRTQDWKFPAMAPPASANPEVSRFPAATYEIQRPSVTPGSGARPALVHHPTEPIGLPSQNTNSLLPSAPGSPNRMSLIDLDLSLPEPSRPSTADSTASQEVTSGNPFHLEGHFHQSQREPSLYISDHSAISSQLRSSTALQDMGDVSDFSASDVEGSSYDQYNGHSRNASQQDYDETAFMPLTYEQIHVPSQASLVATEPLPHSHQQFTMAHFPALPPPPSVDALSGTASHTEMANEMHRMLGGLTSQLEAFRDVYETLPTRDRDRRDSGPHGDED